MLKYKYFTILSSLCVCLQTTAFALIENSVVPTIDKYENIDNFPKEKISDNHFKEITAAFEHLDQKVRIVTYNLLCDDRENGSEEANKWHNRVSRVIELFKEMQPDIICIQEQYQHQLDAWLPQMGEQYSFYGSPRQDGEVNGVVYRNDRFQLIQGEVFTIPSERWKTNTVTMAQLKDLKNDRNFAVFNTHLTFSSNNERENEAEFITAQMTKVAENMPVILAGDLNTFPCFLDEPFPYLDGSYVQHIFTKWLLKDSYEIALLGHVGPISSFTNAIGSGTPFKGLGTPGVLLDHIYFSKGMKVLIHAVQPGKVDGYFPSDHMPVLVDFIVSPSN